MCMWTSVQTWGRDSDGRVDPPRWLCADIYGGASQSCVGQIRKNSEEKSGRNQRRSGHIGCRMTFCVWCRSSYILTCICCPGGGSLCVVEGKRCGPSPSPTLAGEAVTPRRWAGRWTSYGPQERTGGWAGWTHQTEIWEKPKQSVLSQ